LRDLNLAMSVALCFQHEATGRLIEELSPVQRDLRHVIPFTTTCLNRYELLAERFRSCNTQYGVIASGLFKLHYFSIKLKVLIVAFPHFGAYRNDFHRTRQPLEDIRINILSPTRIAVARNLLLSLFGQ
jgi:hypothetical protein